MKSIKTTFVRGLSLLLALVIVLSLPISAFAAVTIPDWNATYTYKYDAERAALIDSSIFRALKYLKYDRYNELGNNGYLFTDDYIAGSLFDKYDGGKLKYNPFTDVKYANKAYGTATTRDEDGNIIPDVEALEAGLVCNSFCEYYYFNYLMNIEKMDVKYLYDAYYEGVDRINAGKETYSEDGWYEMAETLVAEGTHAKAYYFEPEDSVIPASGAQTEGQKRYLKLFDTLPIGALIRFGDPSLDRWGNEFMHYAVYAGTADGLHFIIHTCNRKRGPEISTVERMANSGSADKDSYPLAFYVFDNVTPELQFGAVDVYKADPDGKPLANAVFSLVNNDTGEDYTLITGKDGTAMVEDLLIDCEYTLTEEKAPPGYNIAEKHQWTFTLTEAKPTYSVTVTNTPKTGNLKIIKNILPSSAATAGNLMGWKFKVFSNSPSYTTTIRDGVQYRVKVTNKNGDFIYSEPALMSNQAASTGSINIQSLTPSKGAIVDIGEEQRFTVRVSGTGCAYQWQIQTTPDGEWTNLEGETSGILNLTMTEEYRNSKVRVRIIKLPGNVLYSDPITFATPDSFCIVYGPQDVTGTDGTEVTLSVTANGEDLLYQWEMYDEATSNWVSVDKQFGGTYNTATAGTVQVHEIPVGDYYVVEIDTGREGWLYDLTPKIVTISEDNTAELPYEVTFTNELLQGGVLIQKETEDGKNLEGWLFGIYTDEACTQKVVEYIYTTNGGQLPFEDLAPGTYWVKELGHDDQEIDEMYYCASENPQKVTVEAGKTATVRFENKLNRGSIEIIKKGNNGELLAGAEFQAVCNNNLYNFVEDLENTGHYYLHNVPYGTYTIIETQPPEGYEIGEPGQWEVTLDKNSLNATVTIEITNDEILGSLSIKKETEDGKNLAGWLFNVYADADRSILLAENLETDGEGFITYSGLKPGTVWVREEGHVNPDIADLYYCNSTNPQSVEIVGHETATVTFENMLRFGSIEIIKISIKGTPLAGAKFLLEWSEDGSMWEKVTYNTTDHITKGTCTSNGLTDGCLITDGTGIIAFTGLHPKLYYRITELEAPEGYLLLTDYVYTGRLPEDTLKLDFTIVNAKIFELPKTGAKSMTLMPVALLLSTATCVGVLIYLRKKKES